jgi:EamA domain-containing membrane protein RarD
MITSFTLLGLIESHAVFSIYPLLVAALSGPVLKEYVGWKRWSAIFIGFFGVMIILKPSNNVFSLEAIIPLIAALMFALYSLLTRYAARQDGAMTSFFLDWNNWSNCNVSYRQWLLDSLETDRLGLVRSALYFWVFSSLFTNKVLRSIRG